MNQRLAEAETHWRLTAWEVANIGQPEDLSLPKPFNLDAKLTIKPAAADGRRHADLIVTTNAAMEYAINGNPVTHMRALVLREADDLGVYTVASAYPRRGSLEECGRLYIHDGALQGEIRFSGVFPAVKLMAFDNVAARPRTCPRPTPSFRQVAVYA